MIVRIKGKRYELVEPAELRRLRRLAALQETALPPYPPADAQGTLPAVEAINVSIARKLMTQRLAAGLTQEELARLAGVRQETICRLESGKHSPTVRTVERIEKALQRAVKRRPRTRK
jgi:DNA-binding XRE family transcriptional regulator